MGTELQNLNYNIFSAENRGIKKYVFLCCLGRRSKLRRVKKYTMEERIKWLNGARGQELLRAYHLSLNEYDPNVPDKVFQYDAVRAEILRRL